MTRSFYPGKLVPWGSIILSDKKSAACVSLLPVRAMIGIACLIAIAGDHN